MTNNSKKLTKYSKNIRLVTKRRRYRRKNSMRNKILHGGLDKVSTLKFDHDNKVCILTKKRPLLSFKRGIGIYQLTCGQSVLIQSTDLNNFSKLIKQKPTLWNDLYKKLSSDKDQNGTLFHFTSLEAELSNITSPSNDDDVLHKFDVSYTEITINNFSIEFNTEFIQITINAMDDTEPVKKKYTTLKNVYDTIIETADIQKLQQIYQNIPLSKINPELPSFIKTNQEVLGSGGFGTVYKVSFDKRKEYALKVITKAKTESLEYAVKLMNGEVIAYNTISQLVCDNNNTLFCKFVNAYFDFTNNHIYVLMEYCGSSLYKHMATKSRFSEDQITPNIYKWLINTARGLQCMHSANYAHLDIKPANIVIDDDTRESKLIDFGLIFNFPNNTVPIELNVVGTSFYMPPEMIRRSKVSSVPNCDVYSLGISFIECAFASHYNDIYQQCSKYNTSFHLMYAIFRYVPPTESQLQPQPQPQSLVLPHVIQNNDGDWNISNEIHSINTFVCTKNTDTEHIKYTLEDLYRDILAIHKKYPIFKKMIEINPGSRCSIADVISECEMVARSRTINP